MSLPSHVLPGILLCSLSWSVRSAWSKEIWLPQHLTVLPRTMPETQFSYCSDISLVGWYEEDEELQDSMTG